LKRPLLHPAHDLGLALRLYRNLSPVLAGLPGVLAPFSPKLAEGVAGRRGLLRRLLSESPAVRGGVWFHVTSVGEYEQARPLITALKQAEPKRPVIVTHFSPSGYNYAHRRPCGDLHDYLPFDDPSAMARLVAAWRPQALVFIKFDLWPNQVLAARRAGVPVLLLAGSLQPKSARLKPLARGMYRDLFDRFAHIGVCTDEDARRFTDDLGVTAPVSVTGDTRAEQVILRYEAAKEGRTAARLKGLGGRLLVLGSTWPPDEALWLPVLPKLLSAHPDLRVVLTPHEPDPRHLASIERSLDQAGVPHLRLGRLMAGADGAPARVIVVDSIGVLAEIYRSGHLAYVGGSFTTGVHNTMEPAVCGMPVLFGPRIANAEEAGRMVERGAGFVLHRPDEALAAASRLLADDTEPTRLGQIAREVVLEQRGATARSLAVLEPLLARRCG
jgi:3-deoxy-D-manno-octulosonic-acid transferase